MRITKEAIEAIAQSSMGVHVDHSGRAFKSHFVFSPFVVSATWNELEKHGKLPKKAQPFHLLWFLYFVKEYPNEYAGGTACRCDRNTFEKWWLKLAKAVASLDKIHWRNRWTSKHPPPRHHLLTSVDGVSCPFFEQRDKEGDLDPSLYCHKFNGPGLTYEIVLGLYTGLICSLKGPFKSGKGADLHTAKHAGLVDTLCRCHEKCIADGTYKNPVFVRHRKGLPRELQKLVRYAKARQETVNRRIKCCTMFSRLRGFRHSKEVHGICFRAVTNMCEISFEIESPLFGLGQQTRRFDAYYRRYRRNKRNHISNNA